MRDGNVAKLRIKFAIERSLATVILSLSSYLSVGFFLFEESLCVQGERGDTLDSLQ